MMIKFHRFYCSRIRLSIAIFAATTQYIYRSMTKSELRNLQRPKLHNRFPSSVAHEEMGVAPLRSQSVPDM